MSTLVTGGTGFIGINLCRALLATGFDVKTFSTGSGRYELAVLNGMTVLDKVEKISGDIRKLEDIQKVSKGVDCIFHLAAYVPRSRRGDLDDFEKSDSVNAAGTLNVLNAAVSNGVDKVIYSSTQAVYGYPKYLPIDEVHPVNPTSFYSMSKLKGELHCESFADELDIQILRYSYVYGPLQRHSEVMPLFAQKAERDSNIVLHGDGMQVRDFVHVDDVVAANLLCLKREKKFNVFNIGSGIPFSIKELAKHVVSSTKSKSKIFFKGVKDDYSIYLNVNKARKQLNFNPMPPKEGLDKYLTWRNTSDV